MSSCPVINKAAVFKALEQINAITKGSFEENLESCPIFSAGEIQIGGAAIKNIIIKTAIYAILALLTGMSMYSSQSIIIDGLTKISNGGCHSIYSPITNFFGWTNPLCSNWIKIEQLVAEVMSGNAVSLAILSGGVSTLIASPVALIKSVDIIAEQIASTVSNRLTASNVSNSKLLTEHVSPVKKSSRWDVGKPMSIGDLD